MSTRPGGYGSEAYADPFGAGGPLHVVRARAIKGQVVRVVFDEEPVHRSPAGTEDALNPTNYVFSIVTGQATSPQAVGVDSTMVTGPVIAVAGGDERAFDVHTDRALIDGIRYKVEVFSIKSRLGQGLGFPTSAEFMGVVKVQVTLPPQRRLDNTDIKNSPFDGFFDVDDSGDLAPHSGLDAIKKRIFRRMTTPKNAFSFLPGYGVGLAIKDIASIGQIQSLKADLLQQVRQEPEVEDADAKMTLAGEGILTVLLNVRTKAGDVVVQGVQVNPAGVIQVI